MNNSLSPTAIDLLRRYVASDEEMLDEKTREKSNLYRSARELIDHLDAYPPAALLEPVGEGIPMELTPEQWGVSRSEFIRWANRYEDAKTSEAASVIADIAGADIYRAVHIAASPKTNGGMGS